MEAKDLFERGESYASIQAALDVCARHLRRLLAEAGIHNRPVGRPRSNPTGRRISYAATGLF